MQHPGPPAPFVTVARGFKKDMKMKDFTTTHVEEWGRHEDTMFHHVWWLSQVIIWHRHPVGLLFSWPHEALLPGPRCGAPAPDEGLMEAQHTPTQYKTPTRNYGLVENFHAIGNIEWGCWVLGMGLDTLGSWKFALISQDYVFEQSHEPVTTLSILNSEEYCSSNHPKIRWDNSRRNKMEATNPNVFTFLDYECKPLQ